MAMGMERGLMLLLQCSCVVCITVVLHHGVGIVFDRVTLPRDNATARCIMIMSRAVTDRDRYLTGYAELAKSHLVVCL